MPEVVPPIHYDNGVGHKCDVGQLWSHVRDAPQVEKSHASVHWSLHLGAEEGELLPKLLEVRCGPPGLIPTEDDDVALDPDGQCCEDHVVGKGTT